LLALLPMRWLKDHGGKISQFFDLLQGFMIFLAVLWFSDSLVIAFLSGLSYLVAWFPLSYNTQLQPRGLANLFLTLAIVGLWFYTDTGSFGMWAGVLILSLILIFLHKMAVQMWVIYLLGFGIWAWDWKILFIIPASILLAMIVSKGFYFKILKAHWDIISFWHENINYLGSHHYYESPIYQKEDFVSTAVHKNGWHHQIKKLLSLFKYNVFIILLPILIYKAQFYSQQGLKSFLWWWLGLTYLWALLTTFIPHFKALGSGNYYLYHSLFPIFLLNALNIFEIPPYFQWGLFILWAAGIILSGAQWDRYCRSMVNQRANAKPYELQEVLDYLKALPKDRVFCIPFILSDMTAFWTRKKVFWGGHSYGFQRMLKPYFPIMREDMRETLRKKSLNYLLFWKKYLKSLSDIGLEEGSQIRYIFGKGEYELYEFIQ